MMSKFSFLKNLNLLDSPFWTNPPVAPVSLAMLGFWMIKRLVAKTLNRLVNCRFRKGPAAVLALAPGLA